MNRTILAVLIGALAAPAMAQDPAAPPMPVPPPAAREKKVCRADTATGSIMARRICHTRAEWAAIDAANEGAAARYANDRNANGGPTGH